jgi:hypothetical protein
LDSIDLAVANSSGTNQLTVYLTSGALPGSPIESFSFFDLAPFLSGGSVLTAASVEHPSLQAGLQYWIVYSAIDLTNTFDAARMNNEGIIGFAGQSPTFGSWTYYTGNSQDLTPAFDVNASPVPEPRTLVPVGLGLIALFIQRRRHRRCVA